MTELECKEIESMAISHLIRCAFSDLTITTNETSKALNNLRNELKNDDKEMSNEERLVTIVLEDDFSRVQTKVRTRLYPSTLMDIILELGDVE